MCIAMWQEFILRSFRRGLAWVVRRISTMPREESIGICESCSRKFGYRLIHGGFGPSPFAYCDSCCYVALFDTWKVPSMVPRLCTGLNFGVAVISPDVEPFLLACPSRGQFRATAVPRCPHCNQPLDPIRATNYIEADAPGTAKGWSWERSWHGTYCIVIEERIVHDPWDSTKCA